MFSKRDSLGGKTQRNTKKQNTIIFRETIS